VAFAVPDFDPSVGGTTRQTRLQAEALARRGHRVVIVTRRLRRDWPAREHIDGLDVVRVGRPPFTERAALASLAGWLARHRGDLDVLQAVMWPDVALAAAATGLLSRTALLWAIEGEIEAMLAGTGFRRRIQAALRRRAYAHVEHVVLTPRMASELAHAAPELSQQVIAVPVDREHFRPPTDSERHEARAQLGLAPEAFTVLYVGHLEHRKRVDRLISAFAALRAHVDGARLLLVGGGRGRPDDTEPQLRQQVTDAGLEGAVSFCGVERDPLRHLWAADVLALTAEREGLPNSLLEAMACGVPSVAPLEAGGHVLVGDAGLVPESAEPTAVATALLELVDPARRRRMGDAARRESERYDVEQIADEYERLYARMGSAS
jgi:glycosyltransferase involved in cell wall biosynthesis